MLDRLERVFGRLAVPNLSLFLIVGQVFVLLFAMLGRADLTWCLFVPAEVLQGRWWRVFTFFLMPPPPGWFGYSFVALTWYTFYLFGSALEHEWGPFRYNCFVLFGSFLTMAASFVVPEGAATNVFVMLSVTLAFARLFPDATLMLLFVLPVRARWIGWLTWGGFALAFIRSDMVIRLMIGAVTVNYFLFFARDILLRGRVGRRVATKRASSVIKDVEPRHVCHVCGKTDVSNPELDFRYCSKCVGDQCYCPEHIQNHAHVVAPENGSGQ